MAFLKDKIRNIPYWVYDGLGVASSIATLVTVVWAAIKLVIVVRHVDGIWTIDANPMLVLFLTLFIISSILLSIKTLKYAKIVKNYKQSLSASFYNLSHDLRNEYFDLLKMHKKGRDQGDNIESLTRDTISFLQNILDTLCETLHSMTGQEFCGCIKVIENNNNVSNKINRETASIKTFCRSRNVSPERVVSDTQHKKIKINENTDFYEILDYENMESNSCFYQPNLIDYDKSLRKVGQKYRNTTTDWKNYYRSTIVAPIRVANERLFYNDIKVIGFLCVDSMSVDALRNTPVERNCYSNIVKAYADVAFIILNMYGYYLQKAKKQKARKGLNQVQ